jgi:hypothetical protein
MTCFSSKDKCIQRLEGFELPNDPPKPENAGLDLRNDRIARTMQTVWLKYTQDNNMTFNWNIVASLFHMLKKYFVYLG